LIRATKARTCDGQEYVIRRLEPEDEQKERQFIAGLSPQSRYLRYMHAIRDPGIASAARLAEADRHRSLALAATRGKGDEEKIIGIASYCAEPGSPHCEFAVAVADDWQCRGIGTALMERLFTHAAAQGYRSIYGNVFAANSAMIDLARHIGLEVETPAEGQTTVRAIRRLG
jgi:acetyltransferase